MFNSRTPWSTGPGLGCLSASSSWAPITDSPSSIAKHCARWAMHIVSKGHNPLRDCYCYPHCTEGKVNIRGQTHNGQHIAWDLAATVLVSQDLQERRAEMPGSEV